MGRLQEGVSELNKESNSIECSWRDMWSVILNQQHCGLRRGNNLRRRRINIKIRSSGEMGFYTLSRKNSFFGENYFLIQWKINKRLIDLTKVDMVLWEARDNWNVRKKKDIKGQILLRQTEKSTTDLKETLVPGHPNCNRKTN